MRLDVEQPRPATLEQVRGVDDPARLPDAGTSVDVVATALVGSPTYARSLGVGAPPMGIGVVKTE
jgi:hypothetical protein